MAITKDQIFQAADQLTASGSSATLANVRRALGGGSYTTINEALKEWKARQQASTAPIREPAPAAVAARTGELGADIWAIALELANSRLTHEREALEATRAQLETAQQEATELADQLSAELETLQAQHQQATDALQAANSALGQLQQENATLARQAAITEAQAAETTKRADDLKAELQHAHAGDQAQRERHSAEANGLRGQLTATDEALKARTAEAGRLQLELDHAQAQQQHSAAECLRAGAHLTQAQAERGQAQQATSTAREEAARLRGELEALRVQNAALVGALKHQAPAEPAKPKASKPKTPKAPKPPAG